MKHAPCTYKYVEIDTNLDTWQYAGAAIHPEDDARHWEGGTGTLDLTSLSVRQQPMECPFCQDQQTACDEDNKGFVVMLNGKSSALSAQNHNGQTIRFENEQLLNHIPGAKLFKLKGGDAGNPLAARGAVLLLPPDEEYTVDISGEGDEKTEDAQVAVFQACKGFTVKGITLDPEQHDQLIVQQGRRIRYRSDDRERPRLEVAVHNPEGADGFYEVSDIELHEGASFDIYVDPDTGEIFFSDDDAELDSFDLDVRIVDKEGNVEDSRYVDVDVGDVGQAIGRIDEDGEFELERDSDRDGLIDDQDQDDDNDGLPDEEDPDDDGDGVPDEEDDHEFRPLKEVDDDDGGGDDSPPNDDGPEDGSRNNAPDDDPDGERGGDGPDDDGRDDAPDNDRGGASPPNDDGPEDGSRDNGPDDDVRDDERGGDGPDDDSRDDEPDERGGDGPDDDGRGDEPDDERGGDGPDDDGRDDEPDDERGGRPDDDDRGDDKREGREDD